MAYLSFIGSPTGGVTQATDWVRVGNNPSALNDDAIWSFTLGPGITTDISMQLRWNNDADRGGSGSGWFGEYTYAFVISSSYAQGRQAYLSTGHLAKVSVDLGGSDRSYHVGTANITFTGLSLTQGTYYLRANLDKTETQSQNATPTMKSFYKAEQVYTPTTLAASDIDSITSSVPLDGSTTGTLSLTRYSSSYTHNVTFTMGSYSQAITGVGASTTFTLPAAWVAGLPSTTQGNVTVSVQTYNGNTAIGDPVTTTITATVPASVKPSISAVTVSPTGDNTTVNGWGIFVQGYSKAAIAVTAAAGTGSSISSYTYKVGTLSAVSSANSSYTSGVIAATGTVSIVVTATDARGRSASATRTITVYAYSPPAISAYEAFRCLQDGTASDTGTYGRGKMTYVFSSCNGHNSIALARIEYQVVDGSSWDIVTNSAVSGTGYTFGSNHINLGNSYTIRFTIRDSLNRAATVTTTIFSGYVPFNINASGNGIGIGKYSEGNSLDVSWPAIFRSTVEGVSEAGTVTLETGWEDYTTGEDPTVKRWGPFVHLAGAIKPTATVTLNAIAPVQIGSIPADYAPSETLRYLCQGSGTMIFLLTVNTSGGVYISHLRDIGNNNSQYTDGDTGSWFPFSVSWLI